MFLGSGKRRRRHEGGFSCRGMRFGVLYLMISLEKGVRVMAEKGKSKTDVASRAEAKSRSQNCKFCGNKVDVVLAVSAAGKKKMRRICCES